MLGASALKHNTWSALYTSNSSASRGSETLFANTQPNYFAIYEKNKVMVASEYTRKWDDQLIQFPGAPNAYVRTDDRGWYLMASYKVTSKFTPGAYVSQNNDRDSNISSGRHYNEWVISGRYDFNSFLYAKAEEHFVNGTGLAYDTDLNPNIQPNTKLTAIKVGVTF
jgi:predicted porin